MIPQIIIGAVYTIWLLGLGIMVGYNAARYRDELRAMSLGKRALLVAAALLWPVALPLARVLDWIEGNNYE